MSAGELFRSLRLALEDAVRRPPLTSLLEAVAFGEPATLYSREGLTKVEASLKKAGITLESAVAIGGSWAINGGQCFSAPEIKGIKPGSWGADRFIGVISAKGLRISNMVQTKADGGALKPFYEKVTGTKVKGSSVEGSPSVGENLVTGHVVLHDDKGNAIMGDNGLPLTALVIITKEQNAAGKVNDAKYDYNGSQTKTMGIQDGTKVVLVGPASSSLTRHGNLKTAADRSRLPANGWGPQDYIPFEKSLDGLLGGAYDPYDAWAERNSVGAALGEMPEGGVHYFRGMEDNDGGGRGYGVGVLQQALFLQHSGAVFFGGGGFIGGMGPG